MELLNPHAEGKALRALELRISVVSTGEVAKAFGKVPSN